jgi:methionyl-tRNA formyltransferase
LTIVFFGTPEFAALPLKTLLNSEHEVLAVVTQPDKGSGRGKQIKSCPVKLVAQSAELKIFQPRKVREADFISELKTMNPSVIVVVAYGRILPSEIIRLPEFGCVNVHASLLPEYRGAAPINWALINGENKTGITTMLMDEGMDTGPALLQEEVEIKPEDTAGSLSRTLSKTGADILIQTLKGLENGSLKPGPQEGEISYAPILKKTDGFIQWSKSAKDIYNFIRGVNPWPGAYGFIEGKRIKIIKAGELDGNGEPGLIDSVTKNELYVGAGRGRLSILEVQLSGKPVMTIKAFLQGRRLKQGMRFDLKND